MPTATPDTPQPLDPTPLDDLAGSSLLAVFAHPDDESLACGGLLTRCAACDVRVSLLCLTHGEHGPGRDGEHGPGHDSERLGDIRAGELQDASCVLGIRDLVLLDYEDGMLPSADAGRIQADLADAIRARQPEVVVTFDSDGLYWHPDHVALHERVTAAVAGMDARGPAVWYATMPAGAMRAVAEHAAARGAAATSILGVDDPDAFGAEAPAPTLALDVARHARRKLAALACHATQFHGSALAAITPADAPRLLGLEQYRHASGPA